MTRIADLPTPSLLLDHARLRDNARRMNEKAASLGVRFRPHVKTHKSIDVLRTAFEPDMPAAITVSTLREAEYFAGQGINDILYAVGIAPAKLDKIADLIARGVDMAVVTDDLDAAHTIAAHPAPMRAFIEIDSDGHRAGLKPDSDRLFAIAETLGGKLRGVMTHAGGSYDLRGGGAAMGAHAERERAAIVLAAERLRGAGFRIGEVSVGSTPTATFAARLDGVTELRAGVYIFNDLFQAGLGVCAIEDIAISVLASVIGSQGQALVIDAGWMALSRDRGTSSQAIDQAYGLVCDQDGTPIEDLLVTSTNQEHGLVGRRDGAAFDVTRFPVGTLLRILPNHACATSAQHGAYAVIQGQDVIAHWPRISGW